jgi:hypothetical protein
MIGRLARLASVARGAWWTLTAVRDARDRLRSVALDEVALAPPLAPISERGVRLVLDRLRPSCLERALVLQSRLAACGRPHDVVVGVRKVGDEFPRARMDRRRRAGAVGDFEEIARLSPPRSC